VTLKRRYLKRNGHPWEFRKRQGKFLGGSQTAPFPGAQTRGATPKGKGTLDYAAQYFGKEDP